MEEAQSKASEMFDEWYEEDKEARWTKKTVLDELILDNPEEIEDYLPVAIDAANVYN